MRRLAQLGVTQRWASRTTRHDRVRRQMDAVEGQVAWFPPADDTATLPFKARFVEGVLRLGTNAEALIVGQNVPRYDEVCNDSFEPNVSASQRTSCTLNIAFAESKDRAQALATDSLSDAVQLCARGNFPGRSGCQDNFGDFPLVSTVS